MAQTPEKLLELVKQNLRGCTPLEMEKLLTAWGYQSGKTSRRNKNIQVWSCGESTLTLHRPHGRTMKIGAVKQALAEIEKVRAKTEESDGTVD